MAQTTATVEKTGTAYAKGITIPFDGITEPGCYICNWSGHLLRIPEDGISGGTAALTIIGANPLYVTKISEDPFIPVTKARLTAANIDAPVNF
jgi:hypothetical protein